MAGRSLSPSTPTAKGSAVLYYWLLLAIFVEYARPASYIPGFNLAIIYSLIPMALFLVTLFAPGMRPTREIFADALERDPVTLVDLLGTDDGADIEFEPKRLGLTARTPDL